MILCQNCGIENQDPGVDADVSVYRCGNCDEAKLVSIPPYHRSKTDKLGAAVVGTMFGVVIGGSVAGLVGAVVGGCFGLISGFIV